MSTAAGTSLERALGLVERPPAHPDTSRGFLDLLGERFETPPGAAQRLMNTRLVPAIYERLWRPFGARMAMGLSAAEEHELTLALLELRAGDAVLDLACGPGNFVRSLAPAVGDAGLVVGADASVTMLERAVADTDAPAVAYVRADAERLPFRDASFDAVCCYAAMYMFTRPYAVLDELTRVLAPGGRIALMTSCHRGPDGLLWASNLYTRPGGLRVFGRHEVTGALTAHGFADVSQRVEGFAQFVGARRQ